MVARLILALAVCAVAAVAARAETAVPVRDVDPQLGCSTAAPPPTANFAEPENIDLRDAYSPPGVAHYETSKRVDIESRGFSIIASIGGQKSNLAGGHAEMTFKLPNPFYFIP
ncbi:HAD family acid phosphatase [Bradyrhizobium sp. HKCCYLS1011]|uniref:HAD family acid phosphatase n=1 Tax=Bradyrhizobium sp. HKCCYLS1011 TaxID=3420733 RepID=UPI003EC13010